VADPVEADRPLSLWRYRPALPPLAAGPDLSLGEGGTPLVAAGEGCWWKLDFCNPTLSFKDRGAALVAAAAAELGVERAVADSSGNAGTALAAYFARAGIDLEVWVPASTSAKKTAAMDAHGAVVRRVEGDRTAAATAAAASVAASGAYYASHVYQPLFVHGVKTVGYELWEQLGAGPGCVIVPAGNGTLVLGVALAFAELRSAGLVGALPEIVAVQAERCAPLAGRRPEGPTLAEGIAIPEPARRDEILAAVAASGGRVVTVAEEQIVTARAELARAGLWVEPTAAAAWAAWAGERARLLAASSTTVVVLCGAGLKAG